MAEGTMNRADKVRARRLERREGRPLVNRAESRNQSVPRMIARNPEAERRHSAQVGGELRRRRYLKLADAGAELRLPVLPFVKVGWRVVSGLIVAGCVFLLYVMVTSAAFTVETVRLEGAQRMSAAAINTALQVTGSSIFSVQPAELVEILREQFPELERASISVGFPGSVTVRVTERQPLLSWEQAGLTVWVDAAGVAFMPQEAGGDALVKVTALEAPPSLQPDQFGRHQLIRPEMVSGIVTLAQIAPPGAPLIYDPTLGFGWSDPGGWQAFFGQDGSDIVQRMAIYRSILTELSARRLVPTLVSVAQLHAPYYRMDY